jgi:hypothetical protein
MLLRGEDIDFALALPVISSVQKFILPVGAWKDADPLVHPPDSARAGGPITDWEGKRAGETGIVFFNEVDHCYQAAPADGRSVVVINEVSSEQADYIVDFVNRLGQTVDSLSKAALRRVLEVAATRLGLVDIYNSDDDYVRSTMVPVVQARTDDHGRPVGWMRRRKQTVCLAVFVRGPAEFAGPAFTAQQIPAEGAFVVRQDAAYRMVEAGVMLRTYMRADGTPLALRDFLMAGPS